MDVEVPEAAVEAMKDRRFDCVWSQAHNYLHEVMGINLQLSITDGRLEPQEGGYATTHPGDGINWNAFVHSDAEAANDQATLAAHRRAYELRGTPEFWDAAEAYNRAQWDWRHRQTGIAVAFITDMSRGPTEPSTNTPPRPWVEKLLVKHSTFFRASQYQMVYRYNMPSQPFTWFHMRVGFDEDNEAIFRVMHADEANVPDSECSALWEHRYELPSGAIMSGAEVWHTYGGSVVMDPDFDVLQGRESVVAKWEKAIEDADREDEINRQIAADRRVEDAAYRAAYNGQADALADWDASQPRGGGHPILGGMAAAAFGYGLGRRR